MKLLHLKYFVEIADCRSLTRAAERLYISQPYLSRVVAETEARLNKKLFIRSSRGLELTPWGHKAYLLAQSILHQMELLEKLGKTPEKENFSANVSVCIGNLFLGECLLPAYLSKTTAADTILPLRFYHVLTDSMEPVIPVNSLICTRPFDSSYPVKKGDILTFRATRFGETVFITHRYSHTETNSNGDLIYRTHPQRSTIPDPYETTAENLMGIYLFHIPYIGKFFLFLKSGFGVLWLCQISVILFIHRSLANKWS